MNIFKTFEIFLREPLSILREGFIQIMNVQSGGLGERALNIDFVDKKAQITVVNSDKMYNLLQTVMYKKKLQQARVSRGRKDLTDMRGVADQHSANEQKVQRTITPPQRGQIIIGQLLGRR